MEPSHRNGSQPEEGGNFPVPPDVSRDRVPLGMRAIMRILVVAPEGQTSGREQISLGAARRIRDLLEHAGHQVSVTVDLNLLAAWFASVGGEVPEAILIDGGSSRTAAEVAGIAAAAGALRGQPLFKNVPILAVLPARARPDAYEALRVADVDDFLRDDAPEAEVKTRLETALQLVRLRSELATTRDQLGRQTRVDDLTGVMSRRFFFQQAYRECSRSRRYGSPLSCLMIEIDYFRLLNTHFSYAAGDYVLRTVADALGQWTRDSDLVARFADNKFVILLAETTISGAGLAREKIQRAMLEQPWEFDAKPLPVTVSVGEAELRPDPRDPDTREPELLEDREGDSLSTREALAELLEDADSALFIAKRGARTPEAFVPYTASPPSEPAPLGPSPLIAPTDSRTFRRD